MLDLLSVPILQPYVPVPNRSRPLIWKTTDVNSTLTTLPSHVGYVQNILQTFNIPTSNLFIHMLLRFMILSKLMTSFLLQRLPSVNILRICHCSSRCSPSFPVYESFVQQIPCSTIPDSRLLQRYSLGISIVHCASL